MWRKIRVYLDTSVISSLFDDKNPERKRLTEEFMSKRGDFEVYISEITIAEVERTPDLKLREKMRRVASQLSRVYVTDEAERLAHEKGWRTSMCVTEQFQKITLKMHITLPSPS